MMIVLICDVEHFTSVFGQKFENLQGCCPLMSLYRQRTFSHSYAFAVKPARCSYFSSHHSEKAHNLQTLTYFRIQLFCQHNCIMLCYITLLQADTYSTYQHILSHFLYTQEFA